MKKTLKERYQKLRADLKPMPLEEKLDHIWTYYKVEMFLILLFVLFVAVVITGIVNVNRKVCISGVVVNDLSLEANSFISAEYAWQEGSGSDADVTRVVYSDSEEDNAVSDTYNYVMRVVAMVNNRDVDYLIMDKLGMEGYMRQDFFMDLRELFSDAELKALETELVYMEYEETGALVPVTIRLNSTAFGKHFLDDGERFISFAANTKRMDACKAFWEYITNEESYKKDTP